MDGFKGPMLYRFSDHTVMCPRNCIDLQKTAHFAVCLEPPAKMLVFNFLLKLILCWAFNMFERGHE